MADAIGSRPNGLILLDYSIGGTQNSFDFHSPVTKPEWNVCHALETDAQCGSSPRAAAPEKSGLSGEEFYGCSSNYAEQTGRRCPAVMRSDAGHRIFSQDLPRRGAARD